MANLIRCEIIDTNYDAKDQKPEIRSFFASNPEALMHILNRQRLKFLRIVDVESPNKLVLDKKDLPPLAENEQVYIPTTATKVEPVSVVDTSVVLDEEPIYPEKLVNVAAKLPLPKTPEYKYFEISGDKFRMELATGTLEKYSWVEVTNVDEYCFVKQTKLGIQQTIIQKGTLQKKDWVVQPSL